MIATLALYLAAVAPRFAVSCILPDRQWLGVTKEGQVAELVQGAVRLVSPTGQLVRIIGLKPEATARLDGEGQMVVVAKAANGTWSYTWSDGKTIVGPRDALLAGTRHLVIVTDTKVSFLDGRESLSQPTPGMISPLGNRFDPTILTVRNELLGTYRRESGRVPSLQPFVLTASRLTTLALPAGFGHGTVSNRVDSGFVGGVARANTVDANTIGVASIYPPRILPWRPVEWKPKPRLLPEPAGAKKYEHWSLLPVGSFNRVLLGRLEYATSAVPYRAEVMAWTSSHCVPLESLCKNLPSGYIIDSVSEIHSQNVLLAKLVQPSSGYALYAVLRATR